MVKDPEDPEYRRELQRPADVKEDMRQMESRQRVSSILNSQAFREELESIIADQLKHGPHTASLIALQQISELLLPNTSTRHQANSSMARGNFISNKLFVFLLLYGKFCLFGYNIGNLVFLEFIFLRNSSRLKKN